MLYGHNGGTGTTIKGYNLTNATRSIGSQFYMNSTPNTGICFYIPVSKGDIFSYSLSGSEATLLRFFYAEGSYFD